jgi:16S rRNA (cytidine1402-2'-O)-methyltransferase
MPSILHIIPTPLAPDESANGMDYLKELITSIKIWYVEDLRTARRFLKSINKEINIDLLTIYVVNEQTNEDLQKANKHFDKGEDIGLLSDAGCPAVADPGSELVALAQKNNIRVKPYVGPNSILLALMGSGMHGQTFMFHGYLPVKNPERSKAIKNIESHSIQNNCTEIFIETPYRNNQIMQDILANCRNETKVCVSVDLTSGAESIITKSVQEWKQITFDYHKRPAVFLIMG